LNLKAKCSENEQKERKERKERKMKNEDYEPNELIYDESTGTFRHVKQGESK